MPAPPIELALAENLDGAFERLVLEYQDRLFGFALRLLGNPQDAEEAAQDAFVRAYRALKTYAAERVRALAVRPWLYRITLNVVRNQRRRKRLRLVGLDDPAAEGLGDDPSERPDSRLERSRRRKDLASLVAQLPRPYRAPLVLRYVEGLTLEEVSQILDQPIGTTKSNVHRAINRLRESISESRKKGART